MEMSLSEYLKQDGMTQAKAGEVLDKTQGGIAYMAKNRDIRLVFDEQGTLVRWYDIKDLPLPQVG